jgi:septal ring factor EnvC (AmiA/AmiB activator)
MDQLLRGFQIFGYLAATLVMLAVVVGVVWYLAKEKVRLLRKADKAERIESDREELRPYKEAAEGYRLQVESLERDIIRLRRELSEANEDRESLRKRVRELEDIIVSMSSTNQRQQGDLDKLKRQVEDLGDLRSQLNEMLKEMKG